MLVATFKHSPCQMEANLLRDIATSPAEYRPYLPAGIDGRSRHGRALKAAYASIATRSAAS